jgi:hypothetical protein
MTPVKVTSQPQGPITWKLLAYTGGWLWTVVCHVEWRIVIKLRSAWTWLLWRRVTISMWQIRLIGVFPRSTAFASGTLLTIMQGFWIVFTALLLAKLVTQWCHICWHQRILFCLHALWKQMLLNYYRCIMRCRMNQGIAGYIAVSSDLQLNEGLLIFHSIVTNCGVSLNLWAMKPTRWRKRNLHHTHPAFLCYMLKYV